MEATGARPASAKNLVQENVWKAPWGTQRAGAWQDRSPTEGKAGQREGGRAGPPGRAHEQPSPLCLADDDDDANSYENVLICKQKDPESGEAAPGAEQGGRPSYTPSPKLSRLKGTTCPEA